MRILYISAKNGTSLQRFEALKRLGHFPRLVDPAIFLPKSKVVDAWVQNTGGYGLSRFIERHLLDSIEGESFDYVLVGSGALLGPNIVRELRKKFGFIANYNNDDPFSREQFRKWRLYRASIPEYDLLVVLRKQNVSEVLAAGGRNVRRVHMTSDEVVHVRRRLTDKDLARWSSDVCFVGTWMPERGPFIARLLDRGVPVSIWGDNWHKAKQWSRLKKAWRGPGLMGEDYIKPLLASKICLGLLSKMNRDLHTRRSVEIPALGALLCAERTSEHLEMYQDGTEAVFWENADDCAEKCLRLLKSPKEREEIAHRGYSRALNNRNFNEPMLRALLNGSL